jgi:hypothetical protein
MAMTESEWATCTRPDRMLRFLLGTDYPRIDAVESFPDCRASDRKLRLFACACYHRLRELFPDPQARAAVEVAERFADGLASREELEQVHTRLQTALDALEGRWRASQGSERAALHPTHDAIALALQITRPEAPKAAYYASSNAYLDAAAIRNPGAACYDHAFWVSQAAEERAQTDLLRDLFGSRLFRPPAPQPSGVNGAGRAVVQLARSIYEERRFADLPILADALEEAGVTDGVALLHLRSRGPHTRGCHVLDEVLGQSEADTGR